jgi:hypothetical protein
VNTCLLKEILIRNKQTLKNFKQGKLQDKLQSIANIKQINISKSNKLVRFLQTNSLSFNNKMSLINEITAGVFF